MRTLILISLLSSFALASEFTVYKTISGCKYFVAEQGSDYSIVDAWNCWKPSRDDKGSGSLNSFGFKDVILEGNQCRVYVDNYLLTRSSALDKLADKCD